MANTNRKRIGFLMNNDDLGVIYYLNNIIQCLTYLSDDKKPVIILFYDKTTEKHISIFENYPYLEWKETKYPNVLKLYILSIIKRKNYYLNTLSFNHSLNGIFPVNDILFKNTIPNNKLISWITDFQHKFYPQFFGFFNKIFREYRFNIIIKNADGIVLSSSDAKSHLQRFYKEVNYNKVKVLNFLSHVNTIKCPESNDVIERYQITNPYFIVSNQFYRHKNHKVVLKAIKNLLNQGFLNFEIVFTGKKEDHRDMNFYPEIEDFIKENNIENKVKILGLIPREDQLALLKSAIAIIQPSFFEGWNTSIEDAKTLKQQVICSNLPVHQEQMLDNAFYFDPENDIELSNILIHLLSKEFTRLPVFNDFNQRVNYFAENFINLF